VNFIPCCKKNDNYYTNHGQNAFCHTSERITTFAVSTMSTMLTHSISQKNVQKRNYEGGAVVSFEHDANNRYGTPITKLNFGGIPRESPHMLKCDMSYITFPVLDPDDGNIVSISDLDSFLGSDEFISSMPTIFSASGKGIDNKSQFKYIPIIKPKAVFDDEPADIVSDYLRQKRERAPASIKCRLYFEGQNEFCRHCDCQTKGEHCEVKSTQFVEIVERRGTCYEVPVKVNSLDETRNLIKFGTTLKLTLRFTHLIVSDRMSVHTDMKRAYCARVDVEKVTIVRKPTTNMFRLDGSILFKTE
ncbi:hypothetical protein YASMINEVIRUS_524, partial [Yasminevirus sp. GU-2018]